MNLRLGTNISTDSRQAAADVALVASLGGVCVRTSQEGPGPAARLAPYRKACDDHGVELVQCCQTPGHVVPKTQAGTDAYAHDVAEAASVADRTSTGNEVNGYGSNEKPNPHGQAEIMLACIEAVKKYAPGALLATPSLCPASGKLGDSYVDPLLFFDTMVATEPTILRGGVEVDWHGYDGFGHPPGEVATWNTCWRTRALHDDLRTLGHSRMRITWSEFGEPNGNYPGSSPTLQAKQFDGYIAEVISQRAAGVRHGELIWYQLRNTMASDWTGRAGLVDIHGAPLPVAARFTAATKLAA